VRLLISLIAALATVAVVAGCGGASSEEKWAGSVCTDIANWQSQVKESTDDIKQQLQSPTTGTLGAVRTDIQSAVDATKELSTNLKGLDPPGGDAGAQAQQQLNAFIARVESTATQAKATVASVPEGASASEAIQSLAPLVPAVQSLATATSNTIQSVKASGEKIKEGFDKADSCKQFS
jgi:hypothetical protein